MKKLILIGVGLAGAAAFIGFDAVEAFVDDTRTSVRSHLMSPAVELQRQLADAKRLSGRCVDSIQKGEMALARLGALIDERERDLAYRQRQLAIQRTVLEKRQAMLELPSHRFEIGGRAYGRVDVNRDAVLRAKTYSSNREICDQLETTLTVLKAQRGQTGREINDARLEQRRLEHDVKMLRAELENLQARKAVAQTRRDAEYTFDRSTFDKARDKIADIRASIAVQNKQLDMYGRYGRIRGGGLIPDEGGVGSPEEEDGAVAIATALADEDADDEERAAEPAAARIRR